MMKKKTACCALLQDLVDGNGQLAVFFGDHVTGVVGAQFNANVVVHIDPHRMMVVTLSDEGHTGHEGKCLLKVLKPEFSYQFIVCFFPHKG
jgi:hypothetical protein